MEKGRDEIKSTHQTTLVDSTSRPGPVPGSAAPAKMTDLRKKPAPQLRARLRPPASGCLHLRLYLLRQHLHKAVSEAHSCQIPPYLSCKHRCFTILSKESSYSLPWGKQKFQPFQPPEKNAIVRSLAQMQNCANLFFESRGGPPALSSFMW